MRRDFEALLADVEYPSTDGKPMAESDIHRVLLTSVIERLAAWYAPRQDVYISGNLMVYYEEGEPRTHLAPDCFVAFGVPNRTRRTYKVWEEGRYPDVVFEFTSARTQDQDLGSKFDVYQDIWQVKEYFLFDPLEEYLDPPLLGYRMSKGELQPIKPAKDGSLTSKALGLTLTRDGPRLVLRDAATGEEVLTSAERKATEAERKATEAARKAAEAAHKAAAAEAENARLKAEIEALRRKIGK